MKFKDDPILETKKSFKNIYTIAVLFFLFALCLHLFEHNSSVDYIQFSDAIIIISFVFFCCTFFVLLLPFTYSKVLFYDDFFYFKKLKKNIFYTEVISFENNEHIDTENIVTKNCNIILNDIEINFSNDTVKNYDDIIQFLKNKNIPFKIKLPYKFRNRVGLTNNFFSFIVGFICLFILSSIMFWSHGMDKIQENDKNKIKKTIVINTKPIFEFSENGEDYDDVLFYSDVLPNVELCRRQSDIDNKAEIYIRDSIEANDTITIVISEYDYQIKISKTKTPTFWDKHFEWNKMKLYKLEHNKKILFDLK